MNITIWNILSRQLSMDDIDLNVLNSYNEKCSGIIKQCESECLGQNRFRALKLRRKARKEMDCLCEDMMGKDFDNNRKIIAEKAMLIVNSKYLNENIGNILGNSDEIKKCLKSDEEIMDLIF